MGFKKYVIYSPPKWAKQIIARTERRPLTLVLSLMIIYMLKWHSFINPNFTSYMNRKVCLSYLLVVFSSFFFLPCYFNFVGTFRFSVSSTMTCHLCPFAATGSQIIYLRYHPRIMMASCSALPFLAMLGS